MNKITDIKEINENISSDTLINGDCLEVMNHIADNSVDMILCDLPYGVLNKNNSNAKWDSIIDFAELWKQYKRITKPNAAIVLFAQGMFTAKLMYSNPSWWRYNLVWDKVLKNGFLNSKRQPLRQHEDICIFASGQTIYNPQMVKCEHNQRNHSRGDMKKKSTNRCYGDFSDIQTIITDEKFPTSIISIAKEHITGKSYHPTQKPVKVLEYLIRTYSNEGDLILDNTMGSGSTCVAAVNEGRKYIGIEKEKKYFDISCERVTDAESEMKQKLF